MPQLSTLEQLPFDIIQDIFLLSGNANFALASSRLYASVDADHLR